MFQEVSFNILEISCPIILAMNFLNTFSISINPRQKTLTLTSVEGNTLQIVTEAKRKYPTGEHQQAIEEQKVKEEPKVSEDPRP